MEQASCRYCKRPLKGEPYYTGKNNYNYKINYYGGFVCSEGCDTRACLELESSMPGAGPQKFVSSEANKRIHNNW